MNRDELDSFFAKADDVLTDWHGSGDAMRASVPDDDRVDELAPAGDSYYEQLTGRMGGGWLPLGWIDEAHFTEIDRDEGTVTYTITCDTIRFESAFRRVFESAAHFTEIHPALNRTPGVLFADQRQAALDACRNRNTGPGNTRGLDGRRRASR